MGILFQQFRLNTRSSACIMCSRILIISLLVASSFAHKIPVCKHETQDITVKACTTTLNTVCGPEADDGATGCNSITRKVCVASTKLVDQSSGKLPAPLDFEGICRAIPKGTCADQTVTVGKTTCSLP